MVLVFDAARGRSAPLAILAAGDVTTPLRTNAAVHHSKDSALMRQMGYHARVGSHRVTYAGVAVKNSSNPSQSEPSSQTRSDDPVARHLASDFTTAILFL
jgi:hypothetical protein